MKMRVEKPEDVDGFGDTPLKNIGYNKIYLLDAKLVVRVLHTTQSDTGMKCDHNTPWVKFISLSDPRDTWTYDPMLTPNRISLSLAPKGFKVILEQE